MNHATLDAPLPEASDLDPVARRRILQQASSDYLSGRISVEKFEELEQRYSTDILAVVDALQASQRQTRPAPKRRQILLRIIRRMIALLGGPSDRSSAEPFKS